ARVTTRGAIQVRAASETPGELAHPRRSSAPELAHRIAVLAIPLAEQRGELANLVATGAQIPRLRDELDRLQHGILLQSAQKRAERIDPLRSAQQRRRQVEAK